MTATDPKPTIQTDQMVYLHGVRWEQYEQLLEMRGESSGVRIAYLKGEVELMSPSYNHEWIKTTMARLLETFAEERGYRLTGVGSWTLKNQLRERGVEPDECYHLGAAEPVRPDLAVEVIWTSGGIDKLEIYRGLEVGEVWTWQDGRIDVWILCNDRYERRADSALLPALNIADLLRFLAGGDQTAAVRNYRTFLRGGAD